MKTYETEAKEILELGKAALQKKKAGRRTALAVTAGVLVCVSVFGVWRLTAPQQPSLMTPEQSSTGVEETAGAPETYAATGVAETGTAETAATAVLVSTTVAMQTENGVAQIIPRWEACTTAEKYVSLDFGGVEYRVTGVPEGAVLSETPLGAGTVTGYDIYEEKAYAQQVSLYEVQGIDPAAAVAAEVENGTLIYENVWFSAPTLEDLIRALDLRNTAVFGEARWSLIEETAHHFFTSEDFADDAVWTMLWDDTALPETDGEGVAYPDAGRLLEISFSVPVLGIRNKTLQIGADGWIMTNLTECARFYFVGQEKAQAFISFVKTRPKHTENVYQVYSTSGDPVTLPEGYTEFFSEAHTVN